MKSLIRKKVLALRSALSPAECVEKSKKICKKFLSGDDYKNASTILLYKAYNNEVDTDLIFETALRDDKKVAYPLSKTENGEPDLIFYLITDASQLKSGYKGILEPDTSLGIKTFEGSADICITPGVAFDRKCHRIGYGKAFYDRYFRLNKPEKAIALAYDIQIVDEFETDNTDCSVDEIITESKTYHA